MEKKHGQAWLSEFAGTTILLFASVLVTRWLTGADWGPASEMPEAAGHAVDGVVIGAVVGLLIISPLGRRSGGHFNPAVSVPDVAPARSAKR